MSFSTHLLASKNSIFLWFNRRKIRNREDSPDVTAYFVHSSTTHSLLARLGLFHDQESLRSNNFEVHANRKWRTSKTDTFGTDFALILCRFDFKILKIRNFGGGGGYFGFFHPSTFTFLHLEKTGDPSQYSTLHIKSIIVDTCRICIKLYAMTHQYEKLISFLYRCPSNEYRVRGLFQENPIPLNACNGELDCSFDEFQTRLSVITGTCDIPAMCKVWDMNSNL